MTIIPNSASTAHLLARFALLVIIVSTALVACGPRPTFPVPDILEPDKITHGRDLANGLAACGSCHGEQSIPGSALSGGRVFEDSFGQVIAPNITPASSGIGEWETSDVVRSLRGAVAPDGRMLSPEIHAGYEWMSDRDLYSIVAYLRALPPVENQLKKRSLGFIERNTTGFFDRWTEVRGYVPVISKRETVAWGGYLVDHVARCGSCHNLQGGFFTSGRYLSGGQEIKRDGESRLAPNITADERLGIGSWSEEEIVYYLQTGEAPGNKFVDSEFCPTNFYARARQDDLEAIAIYLKTLQ